jgi:DNA-directed RNA polymerase specialized sigma subunit
MEPHDFHDDLSVKEIAAKEKVTGTTVRQWKASALKKMMAQLK